MKKIEWILGLVFGLWGGAVYADQAKPYYLVKEGSTRSAIVIETDAPPNVRQAAEELQWHLQRAASVTLPILHPDQAAKEDENTALLLVGPSSLTKKLGVSGKDLQPEASRIKTVGRNLVLLGYDSIHPDKTGASPATLWAVDYYLDHELGVRWLWPGELGTYVPKRTTIELPLLDVTHRPALLKRKLRYRMHSPDEPGLLTRDQYIELGRNVDQWADRHEMGSRSSFKFGHSFTQWWAKYHDKHPDYFAVPPAGPKYANIYKRMNLKRVKLDLSNPAVADQVVAEWKAAGAPDNWNVCPNDGGGFCTCDRCRAADVPPDQDPETIWRARGKQTARFVKFWNRLYEKMRPVNPNVILSSYAYSCYRDPPKAPLKLRANMVLGIVDSFTPDAMDHWRQWHEAGAKLYLRPNWWHTGAGAPYIPLHAQGKYFAFARDHGMIGFDFDSIMGYWGTQGINYYLIARMSQRPDLSVDDVMDEYTSAFGAAAPQIKAYLNYWEAFGDKVAYLVPAGGGVSQDPNGPYETLVRKHHLSPSPLVGSWQVIPYLYTDAVLEKAQAILDRAAASLPADQAEARRRVQFLKDGLHHLRLTRDVLRLGYKRTRPAGATAADFAQKVEQLQTLRRQLTLQGVIWGDTINGSEARRGIPTAPGRAAWTDTDGM